MQEPTLRDLLREAATKLPGEDARNEAQILAAEAFAIGRAQLIAFDERRPPPGQVARYRELIARRAEGEPVAYLIGRREFWSLELEVGPGVLIPRPETELLVELALARLPPPGVPVRLADLGTGSGAIAIALAKERPDAQIDASDASDAALAIAARNVARHGIRNVTLHHGDWLEPLRGNVYDLIATNPPYIRADDPHMGEGDLRFEPREALASGADGLDATRRIVCEAARALRAGGWLLVEHGHDQGERVRRIFADARYDEVTTERDLAGNERVTIGTTTLETTP